MDYVIYKDPLFFYNCLSAFLGIITLKYLTPKPNDVTKQSLLENIQMFLALCLALCFMYLCLRFGDLQLEKLKEISP